MTPNETRLTGAPPPTLLKHYNLAAAYVLAYMYIGC